MSNEETRETTITLRIKWNPQVHRDPAKWDWVELIDPEGETPMEVLSLDPYVEYALYTERILGAGGIPMNFEDFRVSLWNPSP